MKAFSINVLTISMPAPSSALARPQLFKTTKWQKSSGKTYTRIKIPIPSNQLGVSMSGLVQFIGSRCYISLLSSYFVISHLTLEHTLFSFSFSQ